jgi:hypothetical protein
MNKERVKIPYVLKGLNIYFWFFFAKDEKDENKYRSKIFTFTVSSTLLEEARGESEAESRK